VLLCDDGDNLFCIDEPADALPGLRQQAFLAQHPAELFGTRVTFYARGQTLKTGPIPSGENNCPSLLSGQAHHAALRRTSG
jgi:hypothetical protein